MLLFTMSVKVPHYSSVVQLDVYVHVLYKSIYPVISLFQKGTTTEEDTKKRTILVRQLVIFYEDLAAHKENELLLFEPWQFNPKAYIIYMFVAIIIIFFDIIILIYILIIIMIITMVIIIIIILVYIFFINLI